MLELKDCTKFIFFSRKSGRYYLRKNAGFILAYFCDDEKLCGATREAARFSVCGFVWVTHFFAFLCASEIK